MRIEITRSGGFAGMTRTWVLEVSSSEAEQRWLPLAEAEAGAAHHDDGAGRGNNDRFSYRILVGYVEVQFPESRLEDPWRELVDRARSTPDLGAGQGPSDRQAPRDPPELL